MYMQLDFNKGILCLTDICWSLVRTGQRNAIHKGKTLFLMMELRQAEGMCLKHNYWYNLSN